MQTLPDLVGDLRINLAGLEAPGGPGEHLAGVAHGRSDVPYGPAIGGASMVSVQSAVVGGNDVGLEKAGCQGFSGEGEHYRLLEPNLAVVPMKTRKPALNRMRLGPKFLVS
jgi:hypothetical protein